MDDDIIRIMVATDNHLGFAERDPVRCDDSFAAFEEVLRTARCSNVDFVLFAGDMFHENKPSRRTLHSTMELLRTYCFGDQPIFIEVLNDQTDIFKSSMGRVNYEDPFQSVGLPIFSIHGNHDDPSREGGQSESLAAMDLLAVSNLINYFGKAEKVEDIEITPILIRKGGTNLAIYGLGAMRDERLNRMWNQKRVRFVRLTVEQGRDSFFNIFVLHQNRDYGRGKKNCVHESMIPEWMDLVIWGNEHECQPHLNESLVGTYRILQPGSSVATSLSAGESAQCPKHMAFFEIKEKKFRMRAIPFAQNRYFLYADLCLKDLPHLDPAHPRIEEQVRDAVAGKVNAMLAEARAAVEQAIDPEQERAGYAEAQLPPRRFTIKDPHKVLLRLRVDHEGFPALNQQRFGAQYMGEVANPSDLLLLSKKKREGQGRATERGPGTGANGAETWKEILAEGAEEEIHKIRIEDLVNETLAASSRNSLSLMAETEMAQALEDYIVKKQPSAIFDLVCETLERTQAALNADRGADDKGNIAKAVGRVKAATEEELRKGERVRRTPASGAGNYATSLGVGLDSDGEDSAVAASSSSARGITKGRKTTALRSTAPTKKPSSSSSAPRRNARTAAKKVTSYADDEEEEQEDVVMLMEGDDHEEEEEEEEEEVYSSEEDLPVAPRRKRAAAPSRTARAATGRVAGRAAPKRTTIDLVDSGEEAPGGDAIQGDSDHSEVQAVQRRPASSATTAKKASGSSASRALPAQTPPISQFLTAGGGAPQQVAGVKRRQMPSSFSQQMTSGASQKKGQDKKLTAGWDD